MAGRIRTIKPELLEDAVTAGLSDTAFRIFIAAILLADDYGRLRFEASWLEGQIFWAKKTTGPSVYDAVLRELNPLLLEYTVNGQRYAAIRNWDKHQKVSHPGKPRIPAPPESRTRPSGESPETLVPDLRSPISDPDLRPPTMTGERAEAPPSSVPRRFSTGTAQAVEALTRYEAAVAAATKNAFVLPRATFHAKDLCDLLNGHAPPGSTLDALSWLGQTVAIWVLVVDRKYANGFVPSKLLAWLNEGRPDRTTAPPRSGAEVTKQPFDPEAPWMKLGDTGS